MRRKILLVFFLALLTSCPGLLDWSYVLVNGYEVWHINSDDIHIGFTEDGSTLKTYLDDKLIGVPPYVTAVWHDDRYIIARHISHDDVADYKEGKTVTEDYYLVDSKEKKSFGPYKDINELFIETNIPVVKDITWVLSSEMYKFQKNY
ncbi:DUF3997 domain-containing protein [Treponema pedis]|uniref:DUF3997 domain-containing protein n=1 Tax=Treponema pedis TaxID=409322 RepID=UPI0004664AF9|nr:DUF3997 domain-containing protein [Treponema pedis]